MSDQDIINVIDAIKARASTRAFLPKSVDSALIKQLLDTARWAPSGKNTQPWRVAVVQGHTKQQLTQSLITACQTKVPAHPDYSYYTQQKIEPYQTRAWECGMALYDALHIERSDKERRQDQWLQNFHFFHAPIGLIFYIDQRLEQGSWMDMGMFLQNIMLAALGLELATCPQASLADYPDIVRHHLQLSEEFQIVGGMAIGYPDPNAPVNQYRTSRLEVDDFTVWYK